MNFDHLSASQIHEAVLQIQSRIEKRTKSDQARINGSQSHGPTSAEGKLKCSKGALKHGLTARKHIVLDIEDDEEFTATRAAAIEEFRPNSAFRLNLVEELAKTRWRMDRIAILETAHLNRKIGLTVEGDEPELDALLGAWIGDSAHPFDLLRRYSATLQHQYNAIFAALHRLEARPSQLHSTPYYETLPSAPSEITPEPAAPPEISDLEDVK